MKQITLNALIVVLCTPLYVMAASQEFVKVAQNKAALHAGTEDWNNEKKVAEFICRPAADTVLRNQHPSIDRYFLGETPTGTDLKFIAGPPRTGETVLSGNASYRTKNGTWSDATFSCVIASASGKVLTFSLIDSKAPDKK